MPAKGSDELFRLIKSLTPAEKRYFKTFAARHTIGVKNNYVDLFDEIDSMEQYDEKKLRGKSQTNQLPREKNYLQKQVLKSLQLFYAEDSVQLEVENNIQQIRILQKKRLYDISSRLIEKTKVVCEKHELFLDHAKVLKLERMLMKDNGQIYQEKYFTPVNNATLKQLEFEKNHVDYFHLQNHFVSLLYSEGDAINKKGNAFEKLLDHPLLQDENRAITLYSKCIFNNIFLVYYRYVHDYPKSYFYAKKYLALKKEEFSQTNNTSEYVSGLQNFFIACISHKKFKECEKALRVLAALPAKNQDEENAIFGSFTNLKIELFMVTSGYAEGAAFVESIKSKFEKTAPFINPVIRVATIYYCFQLLFLNGNYKKALYWMQLLMEEKQGSERSALFSHAQIQNILLHYQLNNLEQIPYLTKSLQRFLAKHKSTGAFEKTMIDFFNQLVRNGINHRQLIAETQKKLSVIFKDKTYHNSVLEYFDYMRWFEGKSKKSNRISA
jgi:hypothetical protein